MSYSVAREGSRPRPFNVRNYLNEDLSSIECIEWAFKEGTTTQNEKLVKRGLGLSRLKKFIFLNDGIMSLYTNDAYYTINNGKEDIGVLNIPIMGTLIIISIKADSNHIYIVDEEE